MDGMKKNQPNKNQEKAREKNETRTIKMNDCKGDPDICIHMEHEECRNRKE